MAYALVADNSEIDVTPYVAGSDNYSFTVNATKYHSYFTLYVLQANPGCGFLWYGTNNLGHSFWRFDTEAPADALQYISPSLTNFLGHAWGFYPCVGPGPLTFPGMLSNDDGHSANIERIFYIGFSDLINGLEFTKGISNAPPEWSATGYNCVSAARGAGYFSGVHDLPGDMSSQNFGVTLTLIYLGAWLDTTDFYYSPY